MVPKSFRWEVHDIPVIENGAALLMILVHPRKTSLRIQRPGVILLASLILLMLQFQRPSRPVHLKLVATELFVLLQDILKRTFKRGGG